jgi:hypothetical protein
MPPPSVLADTRATPKHGFTDVRADLDARRKVAVEYLAAVEVRLVADAADLVDQLLRFRVQRLTVRVAVRRVGRLQRQFAQALQAVGHRTERTFSGLCQGDSVAGISHGNVQAPHLRRESSRNGQPCGVVSCAVDAEPEDSRARACVFAFWVVFWFRCAINETDVGVDNLSHRLTPIANQSWSKEPFGSVVPSQMRYSDLLTADPETF